MERVWGSICDKTDIGKWYYASNVIGKEWHIHAWLELRINLFFSLFIFNDSCYVHCCVASLSIFMTSLPHSHSFCAVERNVSLDAEGTETENYIFTCLRTTVNCTDICLFVEWFLRASVRSFNSTLLHQLSRPIHIFCSKSTVTSIICSPVGTKIWRANPLIKWCYILRSFERKITNFKFVYWLTKCRTGCGTRTAARKLILTWSVA